MPGCRLNGFGFLLYFRSKKEAVQQGQPLFWCERGDSRTLWCKRRLAGVYRQPTGLPIEWVRAPSLFIAQKGSNPLWGSLPFLVRERGLEPPRHNHTHLKRACLPFQHSRKCLSIIPYLPHFVNPFFGESGGRHFPRSDSHSRGRAATGSGFCSPPGTGAPGWRR